MIPARKWYKERERASLFSPFFHEISIKERHICEKPSFSIGVSLVSVFFLCYNLGYAV